jgi:NAD(P)-dependent dehydrogenase (short-subunit alcohol dehydrogenase family)
MPEVGADAAPSAMITGATGGIGSAIAGRLARTAWVHDRIDPAEMIPPADIAELVLALTRMSAKSVVPLVIMSRPGETQWRA